MRAGSPKKWNSGVAAALGSGSTPLQGTQGNVSGSAWSIIHDFNLKRGGFRGAGSRQRTDQHLIGIGSGLGLRQKLSLQGCQIGAYGA